MSMVSMSLSTLFGKMVEEGFVHPEHRSLVLVEQDLDALLDSMERYTPPEAKKWIAPQDR